MDKIKRGQKMICIPCGREVIISASGISNSILWCCGRPMKKRVRVAAKKKKVS